MALALPPPDILAEAELKIPVAGVAALDAVERAILCLPRLAARALPPAEETDVYYEGPAVGAGCVLRLRHSMAQGAREACLVLTHKGPLLAAAGKARPEIELPVCGGYHGSAAAMLIALGLKAGTTVRKRRRQLRLVLADFRLERGGLVPARELAVAACLDEVEGAGCFVELEAVVPASSVVRTLGRLAELAGDLGLDPSRHEQRGYAELVAQARPAWAS
jgi:adenylate cyclase class IV